jgi:hypothetical protein
VVTNLADRYTSDVPLATFLVEYLNSHQASIQNIHITGCDPQLLVGHQRRNVTAVFSSVEGKTLNFVQFAKHLSPAESLWLDFTGSWNNFVSDFWQHHEDTLASYTIQTETIVISGYMPMGFIAKACHLIDLSMLTSLRLFDINLWLLLNGLAPVVELCNLTRFQCYTRDGISSRRDPSILHDFFQRNKSLKHVHMSMSGMDDIPICAPKQLDTESSTATASYLWPLRDRLESLIWHDSYPRCSDCYGAQCSVTHLNARWFDFLCRNFPHLQQLGLKGEQQPNLLEAELATCREKVLTYLVRLSQIHCHYRSFDLHLLT